MINHHFNMEYNLRQLKAKQLENLKNHKCEVKPEDYERIKPIITLLKRLSGIERSIYEVYDMHKRDYILKSDEQKKVFGLNDDNIKIDTEYLYNNIHPDDLPFVIETDERIYQFYSKLSPEEKKDYKVVYDFRVKNTEGIYMRYMHQTIVLETARNGKAWLVLVITDLISEKAGNEKPKRSLINIKTNALHLFTNDSNDNNQTLTKREIEVLKLIARGYDSKTIADKLFISVNTVNNHRQNILRKTGTENTTQALVYCKRLSMI